MLRTWSKEVYVKKSLSKGYVLGVHDYKVVFEYKLSQPAAYTQSSRPPFTG